ncbi:hypothetical protein BpHYR1_044868 [Brachionus plicatilis]|uniref:Uncharacterized protein n=1 Tax=Brachionus plicatilis TaxID=10195 RepID=A0A3M7R1T2_BRAPC|nr:hypothetical protein BpHYR1_044868 [Brachionus plicatilis]
MKILSFLILVSLIVSISPKKSGSKDKKAGSKKTEEKNSEANLLKTIMEVRNRRSRPPIAFDAAKQ